MNTQTSDDKVLLPAVMMTFAECKKQVTDLAEVLLFQAVMAGACAQLAEDKFYVKAYVLAGSGAVAAAVFGYMAIRNVSRIKKVLSTYGQNNPG